MRGVTEQPLFAVDREVARARVGVEPGDLADLVDAEVAGGKCSGGVGQVAECPHRLQPPVELDRPDVRQRRCPAPDAGVAIRLEAPCLVGAVQHRQVRRLDFTAGSLDRDERMVEVSARQSGHLRCAREVDRRIHVVIMRTGV